MSQPTKVPIQIGGYEFGKPIGKGTFGKVCLATHILTGEKVAIKILNKLKIVDITDIERVQREIHILKIVRHPNIIQLYEIMETQQQLFLVMEYAQKGELFDTIVKNQRLQEDEACRYFQQIISALEYMHRLNIVHRDLKPENMLIDYRNNLKFVDFGLSNTYQPDELLKTACGSPCYAPPEMIQGKQYKGLSADLWSCGVVLFVMVCGYLPFEDNNTTNLYRKILSASYNLPKFLSSDAVDLIRGLLTIEPKKRLTIPEIRKHPWFQLYKCEYPLQQGIVIGHNKIPLDISIINQMDKLGYDKVKSQQAVLANQQSNITTMYYLLLRKHLISGGKSNADLSSDTFQSQLIKSQSKNIETTSDGRSSSLLDRTADQIWSKMHILSAKDLLDQTQTSQKGLKNVIESSRYFRQSRKSRFLSIDNETSNTSVGISNQTQNRLSSSFIIDGAKQELPPIISMLKQNNRMKLKLQAPMQGRISQIMQEGSTIDTTSIDTRTKIYSTNKTTSRNQSSREGQRHSLKNDHNTISRVYKLSQILIFKQKFILKTFRNAAKHSIKKLNDGKEAKTIEFDMKTIFNTRSNRYETLDAQERFMINRSAQRRNF